MKVRLCFATANLHKVREAAAILGDDFLLQTLHDIGCRECLPETHNTLEGNAQQKAQHVLRHYGRDCFAEDTGLFVEALGGAPGVRSARYAGEKATGEGNLLLLLEHMRGVKNRAASFRTAIALFIRGGVHFFSGEIHGRIAPSPAGVGGFGYDALFIPNGQSLSFAQMGDEEKNEISHRKRALFEMFAFLRRERCHSAHQRSRSGLHG